MGRTAEHPVELSHKEILEFRIQEAIRLARGQAERLRSKCPQALMTPIR